MASSLHRTATTNYLCCVPALEELLGAGRVGLATANIPPYFKSQNKKFKKIKENSSITYNSFTIKKLDVKLVLGVTATKTPIVVF